MATPLSNQKSQDVELTNDLMEIQIRLDEYKYAYQFSWLGIPIIRFPDDIVVFQELVWELQPERVIEVGVARGGSVILTASLLKMAGGNGRVLGVDIDIRSHNRTRIENHPMSDVVDLVEGSSIGAETLKAVDAWLKDDEADIVVLDSDHTHDHVLGELSAYGNRLRVGGYLVLPDTAIENFPPGYYKDREWDKGNNPMTALHAFLKTNPNFQIDEYLSHKAAITESPRGYVRKVSAT